MVWFGDDCLREVNIIKPPKDEVDDIMIRDNAFEFDIENIDVIYIIREANYGTTISYYDRANAIKKLTFKCHHDIHTNLVKRFKSKIQS